MKLYSFILLVPAISCDIILYFENASSPMQIFMNDTSSLEFKAEQKRLEKGVNDLLRNLSLHATMDLFEPVCTSYRVVLNIQEFNKDIQDIKRAFQHPEKGSIFYPELSTGKGRLTFLRVSDHGHCPRTGSKVDNVYVTWPQSKNRTVTVICSSSGFNPCVYTSRKCNLGRWGPLSHCLNHQTTTVKPRTLVPAPAKPTLPDMNTDITPDNAQHIIDSVKAFLEELIQNKKVLDREEALETIVILYKLTWKDLLQSTPIKETLLEAINLVIEQFVMIPGDEDFKGILAARMRRAIKNIAQGIPLRSNQFFFNAEKIMMALHSMDDTEVRDMVIWTNSTFHFVTNKTKLVLPSHLTDYIILPIKEIITSMTSSQREEVERICVVFIQDNSMYENNIESESDKKKRKRATGNEILKTRLAISKYVISVFFPGVKINHLQRNVTIGFRHQHSKLSNIKCGFWYPIIRDGFGVWTVDGCDVKSLNKSFATCSCNHFTDFSLVEEIFIRGHGKDKTGQLTVSYVPIVGCVILALFLSFPMILYCNFRKLRSEVSTKVLFHLWGALLGTNLVYVFATCFHSYRHSTTCKVTAVVLHYFLLSSFSWISAMEFYLYKALLNDIIWGGFVLKLCPIGWGIPAFVVVAIVLSTKSESYGQTHDKTLCWIGPRDHPYEVWIPLLAALLINGSIFGRLICLFNRLSSSGTRTRQVENLAFHFNGAVGIQSLNCVTWVFAFISFDYDIIGLRYLSAILNILQGFFICVFYCLVKKDVRETWFKLPKHLRPKTHQPLKIKGQTKPKETEPIAESEHNKNDDLSPPHSEPGSEQGVSNQ